MRKELRKEKKRKEKDNFFCSHHEILITLSWKVKEVHRSEVSESRTMKIGLRSLDV